MIRVVVNGVEHRLDGDPARPLLDVLRGELGLVGTRFGCGNGECGSCHVLVDGRSVSSCDLALEAVAGRQVVTVEGLGTTGRPHPVQLALIDAQAGQCGYCLSGIQASAVALLAQNPDPSDAEVRAALDRHLCRCGAHNRIVRAILSAAEAMRR